MQPDTGGSRSMIITTTENIPEARVVKTLGQGSASPCVPAASAATSPHG
jgi:hypothetical protein